MTKKTTCIIVDDEKMAREVITSHLSKMDRIEVVASCSNAIEAFNVINSHDIELVFLYINMHEITELSFAKSINKEIRVIFITTYMVYDVDGFNLEAFDYIV